MSYNYDATLKPKFKQNLPKKIVLSKRIKVSRTYECQVTMWVADTPVSKFVPGIGLSIRHGKGEGKDTIRLVFSSIEDLRSFMGDLNLFILNNQDKVMGALNEALEEWHMARAKREESLEMRGKKAQFS